MHGAKGLLRWHPTNLPMQIIVTNDLHTITEECRLKIWRPFWRNVVIPLEISLGTSTFQKDLAQEIVTSNKNIELQFLAKVFRFHMKSGGFHEIRMKSGGFHVKSGGFHEIHPKPCKIRRVFVETSDFMVKSAGFHGEIRRISRISWNLLDFMVKSAGFHEIRQISRISWNPPDFMVKSAGFHECELLRDDQV